MHHWKPCRLRRDFDLHFDLGNVESQCLMFWVSHALVMWTCRFKGDKSRSTERLFDSIFNWNEYLIPIYISYWSCFKSVRIRRHGVHYPLHSSLFSRIIDPHPNQSRLLYAQSFLSCVSVCCPPFSHVLLTFQTPKYLNYPATSEKVSNFQPWGFLIVSRSFCWACQ